MTDNILDNPIWNAMISSNSHLALGNSKVKFFPGDIGPFAGMENFSTESFRELYDLVPGKRTVVIFAVDRVNIPGYWKIAEMVNALQMICKGPRQVLRNNDKIVSLDKPHVAEMIALTRLTNPGPFLQRTIEFGNYKGIFVNDRLVAMAGQRLHPFQYVEVSAVCTHPDYAGKGYGKFLINNQLDDIKGSGEIPFLHVRAENESAINLYKHLGFTVRRPMNIYVLDKNNE